MPITRLLWDDMIPAFLQEEAKSSYAEKLTLMALVDLDSTLLELQERIGTIEESLSKTQANPKDLSANSSFIQDCNKVLDRLQSLKILSKGEVQRIKQDVKAVHK